MEEEGCDVVEGEEAENLIQQFIAYIKENKVGIWLSIPVLHLQWLLCKCNFVHGSMAVGLRFVCESGAYLVSDILLLVRSVKSVKCTN